MFKVVYVSAVPAAGEAPWADGRPEMRIDGPYPMLPQAEYAARVWRHLDQGAEIVAACLGGPWWVYVREADR